jgi:ABC-type multidrug transport system permease subunit
MKRRLDLALALVHHPRLLFLDEPTTGLDPQSRAALWDEVRRLANDDGVTVFLTTQYLEEADVLADRVGIIDRGKIVAEGTPAALKAEIGRPSVEAIPEDPGESERLAGVLGRFGEEAAASPKGVAVRLPEGRDRPRARRRGGARGRPAVARPDARRRLSGQDGALARGRPRAGARGRPERSGDERQRGRMSSGLSVQLWHLARRALLKTLRQPFQVFPVIFFPAMLLAVNASGLAKATAIPGFPTDSYISFAIAVAFIQGGMFAMINTGTNLAEDIETGFFNRLALTPLRRVAMIGGLLIGVGLMGALQSVIYVVIGLIAGAHLAAGFGGALVVVVLGALVAVALGALGCFAALRTGSGEAVQGLFPLFFVFIFLSSSNLPRDLIKTGWFHTVADWNPISYLLEGIRSLWIFGWDGTALWRGFAVALALLAAALLLAGSALRTRLQRT